MNPTVEATVRNDQKDNKPVGDQVGAAMLCLDMWRHAVRRAAKSASTTHGVTSLIKNSLQ